MSEKYANAWGKSHTGLVRKKNEDRFLIQQLPEITLLLVADGVRGNTSGDIAAQIVVDVFNEHSFSKHHLQENLSTALTNADRRIHEKVAKNRKLEGMGTTATIAALYKNKVFWIHIGDSRMYRLHGNTLKQITTDHTFIQDFIDDGSLTLEQAKTHPLRNMLDQCVGCDEIEPETGVLNIEKNDRLLLCSDGLTAHLTDAQIASILREMPIQEAGEHLIQTALKKGGTDNVTVVVYRV